MKKIERVRDEITRIKKAIPSTEDIFDIENPPPYTCPVFHNAISAIVDCEKAINKGLSEDESDELKDALSDAEFNISGLAGTLEHLNDEVDKIRHWGIEWKEFAKQLIENYDIPMEEISDLYSNIKEDI